MSQTALTFYKIAEILSGISEILPAIGFLIAAMLCRDRIRSDSPREGWLVCGVLGLLFLYGSGLFPQLPLYIIFSPRLKGSADYTPADFQVLMILELISAIAISITYAITWALVLYAAFSSGFQRGQSSLRSRMS